MPYKCRMNSSGNIRKTGRVNSIFEAKQSSMQSSALGNRISKLRTQSNMTQKELADLCNVDIRTIQRIESGEVVPRMHTVKLLANALGVHADFFKILPVETGEPSRQQINMAFMAGILYSINALLIVYYLITRQLNPFVHIFSMAIHSVAFIFFLKGFYLLAKNHKNPLLEITALLSMVLLPLTNIADTLNVYFPANGLLGANMLPNIFTLLCINDILLGIGLIVQANKSTDYKKTNLYRIAGVIAIVSSILYLSTSFTMIAAGLMISFISNAAMTYLLYAERKSGERQEMNSIPAIS
jgi:transcriptional regulator with XRE-family HTH domain